MLSIGIFSKISNVTTKTLRYYDEINLLKPVHVNTENGYRFYDVEQLKDIILINKLKAYFFSLEEIAEVLNKPEDDVLLYNLIKQKQKSIQDKLNNYNFILKQIKKDILNLERGKNLMEYLDNIEIKLIETKSKNILFIREKMSIEEYGKYLGKLFETLEKEKFTIDGAPMFIYHDKEFDPKNNDTEIAIPIKEVVKGTRELQGSLCAMGTLKGPYTELTSLYAKLQQWVEKEGYTIISSPYDIYLTDPRITPEEENITEVYFPVKKL